MKIAIIGAGLSGLSCAYRLEQLGFKGQLDIFEKKPAVGEANIFLEFVSELFYRPLGDFFAHLAQEYKLYLLPQQTIYRSQSFGPTRNALYEGFTGHVVVRGQHEHALEKQLAKQIKSKIKCNQDVSVQELKGLYDFIVLATGRLQDVPQEIPVRVDRYVQIQHALIETNVDEHMSKVWFNQRYAGQGYAFQLPLDQQIVMIAVATPNQWFNLQAG